MQLSCKAPRRISIQPKERDASYLPQIDGLRGIAILAVILHHFGCNPPGWADWGPLGPSVFFLLSGYLITLSLWKLQDKAGTSGWHFGRLLMEFHARRIFRLLPVVLVLLAIGCLLGLKEYRETWTWHATFLTNFLLVKTNQWVGSLSHLWSLSLQEQFYLLWPLVLVVPRSVFPAAMIAVVFGAAAFRFGCIVTGASEFSRWFLLPSSLDAFAVGGLVAWMLRYQKIDFMRAKRLALPLCVIALSSLAFSRYLRFLPGSNPATSMVEVFECVFFVWLLLRLVAVPNSLPSRALAFEPLIFVGKVSYGIFVFHALVATLISPLLVDIGLTGRGSFFPRIMILVAASIAVAAVSWHLLEQPLNRWVRGPAFSFNWWMRGRETFADLRMWLSAPVIPLLRSFERSRADD